jgi:YfiH family protein
MIQIVGRDDAKAAGEVTYFEAPPLNALGLVNHAFCTRSVRLKRVMYSPIDLSAGSAGRLLLNREVVASTFGFEANQLITMDQVHGNDIWIIDEPLPPVGSSLNHSADALLTDQRDIAIGVLTADCVPIILVDPNHPVIGIIHAGWRGTLLGIAPKVLDEMARHFGTRPEELFVAIGPSVEDCCYEVDEDVMDPFRSSAWNWKAFSRPREKRKWFLNLALANIDQMRGRGLRDEQCCWIRVCTVCNNDILFSYRAEGPGVGEQISFIQLRDR